VIHLNPTLIALGIFTTILVGTMIVFTRKLRRGSSEEREEILAGINSLDAQLEGKLLEIEHLVGKKQVQWAIKQLEELTAAYAAEKRTLEEVESKLEAAQRDVETKEAQQQEMKSAKSENEEALASLLANYTDISKESILLEQNLASSLKHLDSLLEELELTAKQREYLQSLSEALASAGSRLRDLITEFDKTKQRLDVITQQHQDLEEEYTKLVEQQLGGW
jgi:chromosome segregation ATPase